MNKILQRGWVRALIFAIVFIVFVLVLFFPFSFVIKKVAKEYQDLGTQSIQCLAAILAIIFCQKVISKEKISELGINFKAQKALEGVLFGTVLVLVASLFMAAFGWVKFQTHSIDVSYVLNGVLLMILVGIGEELICRTYFLKNLIKSFGKWPALVSVALVFSMLHWGNASADFFSGFEIFFAGILLGVNYLATGNIWFAIGLHFSWNFVQGYIMGFEISGHVPQGSVLQQIDTAPVLFSGGGFGLEGSVAGMGITIIGIIWLLYKNPGLLKASA